MTTETIAELSPVEAFVRDYSAFNRRLREADSVLLPTGLPFLQALTLTAIEDGCNQPTLVSTWLGTRSQTILGLIDRLERDGWLRRVRDMKDRRAVRLQLTPKYDEQRNTIRKLVLKAAQL